MTLRVVELGMWAALSAPGPVAAATGAGSAAKPDPFTEPWSMHDPASTRKIDHGTWSDFLKDRVDTAAPDGVHRVRYAGVTRHELRLLREYIAALQKEKVTALNRAEQRAFWINLYNAKTVAVVLSRMPIASVLDISFAGSAKKGPWDTAFLEVEGRKLTLDQIENRILRPIWRDARIHFALNCASIGCPDLAAETYTAENTERLMEAGARAFLASERGASFKGDTLTLSSLFDWYKEDFGKTQKERFAWLAQFAPPGKAKRLQAHKGAVSYAYAWALNAR